jgi:hypothetical protein
MELRLPGGCRLQPSCCGKTPRAKISRRRPDPGGHPCLRNGWVEKRGPQAGLGEVAAAVGGGKGLSPG